MATGQPPYMLCRLLDEYPDVFDAYFARLTKGSDKESFFARRERTRSERVGRTRR